MLDKICVSVQELQNEKLKKSNAKELSKLLESEKERIVSKEIMKYH